MRNTEFESQVISLSDYIYNSAKIFTRDEENARDLAQETILRALENYEKFKMNTNLKGWLKVMMRNIFINNISKKANKNISYNSEDYRVMIGEVEEYSPENQYATNQIQRFVEDLSDDYRVPFQMHNAGYKYHEIAEELNIPIGTVKSRIFQARRILAKKIQF